MKNASKTFFLIFQTWKTFQKRILSCLFDTLKRIFILKEMKRFKNMLLHLVKMKKKSKTCFFTLNRWKMLTVKTYLFILYTKKALQKHAFSFCNPWNTLPKKCFQFFVKMKSAPQACFQFVKMTSLRKRVFYIDVWKTLQKRVLKFW